MLLLGGLAVLAWLVLRRRAWRHALAGGLAALVLIAAGAIGLVNAYVGYVPDTRALARLVGAEPGTASGTGHGQVSTVLLGDPRLAIPPTATWVYTPPEYDTPGNTRRYPVVYLFHGYPGGAADWFQAGRIDTVMDELIRAGLIPPAIVVASDLNAGGIRDTEGLNAVRGGPQVTTFVVRQVVGWTDAHLRTIPGWRGRAIGGMSSGGYAALDIGLRHQTVFGAVIALEPYGDPGTTAGARMLGGDPSAIHAHSPTSYTPTLRFAHRVPTFVDVGGRSSQRTARTLANELAAAGQPVVFRVEAGQGHTWREARAGVPYGLVYTLGQL